MERRGEGRKKERIREENKTKYNKQERHQATNQRSDW